MLMKTFLKQKQKNMHPSGRSGLISISTNWREELNFYLKMLQEFAKRKYGYTVKPD